MIVSLIKALTFNVIIDDIINFRNKLINSKANKIKSPSILEKTPSSTPKLLMTSGKMIPF